MDKIETDKSFCAELMMMLNDFRKDGLFCDVKVGVGSCLFQAHRNVLAANSPYFKALLSNDMKENLENLVRLDDLKAKVVESILDFMYSGKININKDIALDLLIAADYLIMPELKEKGCQFLIRKMTASNCLTVLNVSKKYDFVQLHKKALTFAQENFNVVCKKENFKDLSASQLEEIISGNNLVSKEKDVFESLVEWVNYDLCERNRLFCELFSHVRLIFLPRKYLMLVVEENDLVKRSEICRQYITRAKQYFSASEKSLQNDLCRPRACQQAVLTTGGLQSELGYKVSASSTLFIPASGKCSEVFPMLTPRKNHGIAVHEGMVYVVGGETNNVAALCSVELYDPKANSWSSVMSMRKESAGLGLAVLGDYLYAVGGCSSIGRPQNIVQRYNPRLNRWQYVAQMCFARTRHSVVSANGFLFAFGGYGTEDYIPLKTAEMYNPENDMWINISSMKHRRSDMSSVCVNHMIFIIGGEDIMDNVMKLDSCEIYTPSTDTWGLMTTLPSPLSHSGIAAVGKKIYLFGGLNSESKELDIILSYDIEDKTWQTVGCLPLAIEGGACCTITLPGELMDSLF